MQETQNMEACMKTLRIQSRDIADNVKEQVMGIDNEEPELITEWSQTTESHT